MNREQLIAKAAEIEVPELTAETLVDYALDGTPTGGFLQAVLSNDLFEAYGRADDYNMAAMRQIVEFVYNSLPSECWGSVERVAGWTGLNKHELANEER